MSWILAALSTVPPRSTTCGAAGTGIGAPVVEPPDEVPPVPPPLLPPAEVLPAEPATLDPLELELPPDVLCVPVLPWEVPVPLEPLEPVDPEELEAALVEPDPAVPLEPTEEVAAEVEDPVDAPVVAFVEPQAAIAPISTALRNQSQPAE
jgi:hypothetical protein